MTPAPPGAWPIVGRERELRRVEAAIVDDAITGVVLVGPAGVGKSRLAAAGADLGVRHGYRLARALGTRASSRIPLGALAPLLPTGDRGAVIGGDHLRRTADAIAGDGRVVLLVDDAHLLDEASATVLRHVVDRPLTFLMATMRTGDGPGDAVLPLWKDALVDRLDLTPLGHDDVDRLLGLVLGPTIDGRKRRLLWDASGGNPLFIRELVLGALDGGILGEDDGVWRLRPSGLRSAARRPRRIPAGRSAARGPLGAGAPRRR